MTRLSGLNLEDGYRTNDIAILDGFYLPCLLRSVQYDRSVGYFNSGALAIALRGISELVRNNGRIRLVASPNLCEDDLQAIEQGYETRAVLQDAILRSTSELVQELPTEQRKLLRWLIANDRLDIRLASIDGLPSPALYHEKRGIFRDAYGNVVTFIGSANETAAALRKNFESIEVFRSWVSPEKPRTERHVSDFERLWKNEQVGLTIEPFPEAARSVILSIPDEGADPAAFDPPSMKTVKPTVQRKLHNYQNEAVRAWVANRGRGILRMPTGSGKTITALFAARLIIKDYEARGQPLAVVIVAPFKDLVEQWNSEARNFGLNAVLCYESRDEWEPRARNSIAAVNGGVAATFAAITTNATFGGDGFQEALEAFNGDVLLVADEVHNIGSTQARTLLSPRFKFRLGLSATPERWFDDVGTDALLDYFGGVVYSMTLKEAIDRGALTPYRYFVHPVRLNIEETLEFMRLSDKISDLTGFASIDDESTYSDQLKMLLIKRARVSANAAAKPILLNKLIRLDDPQSHTLIYCGVGSTIREGGRSTRIVNDIARGVNEMHIRAMPYTAETPSDMRQIIRSDFARGTIQYLVAMRCLDEGVDIPATRRAYFLASSTNPRQFIQRRGRVLRRSDGKKRAEIHDMLTFLSEEVGGSDEYERKAVERELKRVRQFAEIAENGDEALGSLSAIIHDQSLVFQD